MPDHLIRSQIYQCIKAICEHDINVWLALFEPDATIEDSYGQGERTVFLKLLLGMDLDEKIG